MSYPSYPATAYQHRPYYPQKKPVYYPRPQNQTQNFYQRFQDYGQLIRNHYLQLNRQINVIDNVIPTMNINYNYQGIKYHPLQITQQGCPPPVPQFQLAYQDYGPGYGQNHGGY